jgi:hypothetical protein
MSEVLAAFNKQKNIWHSIEFVIGSSSRKKGKYHERPKREKGKK